MPGLVVLPTFPHTCWHDCAFETDCSLGEYSLVRAAGNSSGIPVPFRKLIQPSTWNTNDFNEDAASCKQMIRFVQERL